MNAQDLIVALHGCTVIQQTADFIDLRVPLRPGAFLPPVDKPPFEALPDPEEAFQASGSTFRLEALAPTRTVEQWFEGTFWPLYPRKVGKGAARAAAKRKAKTPEIRVAIIAGLKKQLPAMAEKDPEYIPHPATWLNQERWLDEVATEPQRNPHEIQYPEL